MLRFASVNGHEDSQSTLGWLQATFRPDDPPLVDRGIEVEWLARGMTAGGSRVCRQRLALLDPERYQKTLSLLRRDLCGIGSERWDLTQIWPAGDGKPISQELWYYSATGDEGKVRSLLSLCPWDVNSKFLDETPLIAACRSGHSSIARLLVDKGANASLLDHQGRGALHFLSSFDTGDIAEMAHILVGAGGELEVCSKGSSDLSCSHGRPGNDTFYGHGSGTVLLWAVQTNCLEAVKVLLDLGAKVFPTTCSTNPKDRHFSPVHFASRMHQSEILKTLLDNANTKADVDIPAALNEAQAMEEDIQVFPLAYAASYPGRLAAARIMLHGADHIRQCYKTVHLLLDAGATADVDGKSVFSFTSSLGPCHGLRALFSWGDGRLRPNFTEWVKSLLLACGAEDRDTFDHFLAANVITKEGQGWPEVIDELARRTDDTYYVNAAIAKHKALSPALADYSAAFSTAWIMGHQKVARCIFEQTDRYDVVTHREIENKGIYGSVLGSLIWDSKFRPSSVKTIGAFLNCVGARDSIFENVIQVIENDDRTCMNALQCALIYRPRSNVSTGADILNELTKHFRHPNKHLGTVFGPDRDTLLHLAIKSGHPAAADFLLKLPGIDAAQRHARGLTPFDACITRWANTVRDESLSFTHDIESGVPRSKAIEYWGTETKEFIEVLTRNGAHKHGSLSHMFKRVSDDEIQMIQVDDDGKVSYSDGAYQCK